MEYDKMLDRLYISLPKEALTKERFEIPKVDSFIQGSKTFVKNYGQILKLIRREETHLLKFLTRETATSASPDKERLVLNAKFTMPQLNALFETYVNEYVLCRECGKPDTRIIDQQGVKRLKCDACGAVRSIKKL